MGKLRTGLTGWGKMLAYPLLRPAQDIRESVRSIREASRAAREERQQRQDAAAEVAGLLADHTPAQKFAEGFAAWGWTEQELAAQLVAARRTRIAAVATGLIGFAVVLVLMMVLSGWILIVLAGVAIALPLIGVLQGLRFAWWEFAIQTRTLISMRAFLSRADLMTRLFAVRHQP